MNPEPSAEPDSNIRLVPVYLSQRHVEITPAQRLEVELVLTRLIDDESLASIFQADEWYLQEWMVK